MEDRPPREFLAATLSLWSSSSQPCTAQPPNHPLTSSLLNDPLSLVMVILLALPVLLSVAVTLRMPLASMSKVTSIWGTPRGQEGCH